MSTAIRAFRAATNYLQDHPREVARAFRSAMGLRVGIPLPALRWLAAQAEASGSVEDVTIDAAPPGIRVAASVDAMRTPVRASAVLFIERLDLSDEAMTIVLRIEDLKLKLNGDAATPVATLIKSGVLDLTNPGDLITHLPDVPPIVAESRGNRVTLDLMRDRRMVRNRLVRRAVGLLSTLVVPHSVQADEEHLELAFRALPRGVLAAASAVRRHVVLPSVGRLLTRGR